MTRLFVFNSMQWNIMGVLGEEVSFGIPHRSSCGYAAGADIKALPWNSNAFTEKNK